MILNKNSMKNIILNPFADPLISDLLKAMWEETLNAIIKKSQKRGLIKFSSVKRLLQRIDIESQKVFKTVKSSCSNLIRCSTSVLKAKKDCGTKKYIPTIKEPIPL